jgi:hypothetical protein
MSVKSIVKNHSDCFSESCVRNKKIQQNQASSGFDGIAKMIAKKQTTITPSSHSSGCYAGAFCCFCNKPGAGLQPHNSGGLLGFQARLLTLDLSVPSRRSEVCIG